MFPQQEAWKARLAAQEAANAKEREREAEFDRIWRQPAEENWQTFRDAHNGRQLTEEELKARQAKYNAEAPARQEAERGRAAFRNRIVDQLSIADREVEALAKKAHAAGLSDDEVEVFAQAHAHASALRALNNRLGRLDEESADARRRGIFANRRLAQL